MHRILTPWIDFMFRKFGEPSTDDQVGQGRKPKREIVTQASFWCVYLFVAFPLLVVCGVAAWERWA